MSEKLRSGEATNAEANNVTPSVTPKKRWVRRAAVLAMSAGVWLLYLDLLLSTPACIDSSNAVSIDAGPPSAFDANVGAVPEAGVDASAPDTGVDAGPELVPICTSPVALVGQFGGRDVFLSEVDIDGRFVDDAGADAGPLVTGDGGVVCPVQPVYHQTFFEKATVGFLAGSPGYSINVRNDYALSNAVGASLDPQGRAIDALEGNVVSFDIAPRPPDAGLPADAGPLPSWHVTLRMNPDPDASKWTVSVFEFTKH